ncbi:extensin-like [Schistocerca americana]|uniref:extensin-like n=1 Tax=Schistocerca americana TaxID=7009 RepID=UPI001F5008DA|nr:extensin-like [Schistocerca americana]
MFRVPAAALCAPQPKTSRSKRTAAGRRPHEKPSRRPVLDAACRCSRPSVHLSVRSPASLPVRRHRRPRILGRPFLPSSSSRCPEEFARRFHRLPEGLPSPLVDGSFPAAASFAAAVAVLHRRRCLHPPLAHHHHFPPPSFSPPPQLLQPPSHGTHPLLPSPSFLPSLSTPLGAAFASHYPRLSLTCSYRPIAICRLPTASCITSDTLQTGTDFLSPCHGLCDTHAPTPCITCPSGRTCPRHLPLQPIPKPPLHPVPSKKPSKRPNVDPSPAISTKKNSDPRNPPTPMDATTDPHPCHT